MTVVLLCGMILLYTAQSLLTRKYAEHYPGEGEMSSPVFTVVSGLVVVVFSLVACGFRPVLSWQTALLAVANGVALVLYNRSIIKASGTGPYSVLMVFSIAGGILMPAVAGAVFFSDTITPVKAACITVILVSVYLISRKGGETPVGRGFWSAVVLLGVSNGLYGSLLDAQQRLTSAAEKEEMVALTFLVAVGISVVMLLVGGGKGALGAFRQTRRSAVYLLTGSLTVAAAIYMLTLLLGLMDPVILYTFDNSGVLLVSVLCSWAFFRERLSPLNAVGCVVMCLALTCMTGWEWLVGLFA